MKIRGISGSVEIAPNIGLADGICDIASTGSTLFKNGLVESNIIMNSQAVLVQETEPYEENELPRGRASRNSID